MHRHLVRHCILLALPTIALVGFGVSFLLFSVPRISASERARVEEESRDFAERMKDGTVAPEIVWEYGRGVVDIDGAPAPDWAPGRFPPTMAWKDWNSHGAKRKAEMWGVADDVLYVWVRDGRRVYLARSPVEEIDYAFWSWLLVPVLLASLVVATASALSSLVSYAKSRDDFLAAAAHDLTTPLVGMRYLIGKDDAEAGNLNERMIRLVGNIRDFLSLGGRRKVPERKRFRIGDAFDAAYRLFAADYEEEASGPVSVSGDASLMACADRELVERILWNVLGNDLKYAAPYGPVSARFRADGGFVVVELADEGQGMTPGQMKRAFDRYWRAKTVIESGKGGFGIGLCTSREYARSMGGDLTVCPNTPRGCVFALRLPANMV